MINNVPRVNELNQIIDEEGNVILNGFGQPIYFYPQAGQTYYDRPEAGTPEAKPYQYKKKTGQYPNAESQFPGGPYTPVSGGSADISRRASISLVFGIISMFLWFMFFSPISILAIVFGNQTKKHNKKGMAGFVLGIIGASLQALFFIYILIPD